MKRIIWLLAPLCVQLLMSACHEDRPQPQPQPHPDQPQKKLSITLDKEKLSLVVGDTITLNVSVSEPDILNEIQWSSSDKNIVRVSNKGHIEALSEGEATISASAKGTKALCYVSVHKNGEDLTSLSFEEEEYTLTPDQQLKLVLFFTPADWQGKVDFSSGDEDVVTVDNEGRITALSFGYAKITATAEGLSASCKINVVKPESYDMELPKLIEIEKGERKKIELIVNGVPYDLAFPLLWSSSDKECFTVDADGYIEGKSFGAAVLKVIIDNGNKKNCRYCYVRVNDASLPTDYDHSKRCEEVPFPYLETPTTAERIAAAEREICSGPIPLRKLIKEEGGKLYYALRNFDGYNPAAVFFGMVIYQPQPQKGEPFASAWAEGITTEDRILIMEEFIKLAGFGELKKIKISTMMTAFRSENKELKQSILIYLAPNPKEEGRAMGVLEFRTLDDDPYKDL